MKDDPPKGKHKHELTDAERNTEADKEQAEPLVDGSGNPVVGGKSVEPKDSKKKPE